MGEASRVEHPSYDFLRLLKINSPLGLLGGKGGERIQTTLEEGINEVKVHVKSSK